MAPDPNRPPTILGPFGEGYCRVCRFIEPLDEQGRIAEHGRAGADRCKGSWKIPPKVTPYSSRLSAFKSAPRKVECPLCAQQVTVLADGRIQGHSMTGTLVACKAGWHTVPMAESMRPTVEDRQSERDHSGGRG